MSIIGSTGLNFSVRNGKRCDPCDKPPRQCARYMFIVCFIEEARKKKCFFLRDRGGTRTRDHYRGGQYSNQLNYPDIKNNFEDFSSMKHTMLLFYMISRFPNRSRAISTPLLNTLLRFHIVPINVIISYGPQRYLILELASLLDAFRGYPFRT